jgi:hypothetical protein
MVDPISQSVSWSVIDGIGLFFGPFKKFIAKSGLSVAFQSGRVGAVGLDFYSGLKQERYDHYVEWQFVLKIVNPGPHGIALEKICAKWIANDIGFYAATSKYNTGFIRPIHPGPTLPEYGDESLPRYIAPGATELLEITCLLDLYHRKGRFLPKKQSPYTVKNYGKEPPVDFKFVVTAKTNKGTTKLKSS